MKSIIPLIIATLMVICFQNCASQFDVKQAEPGPNFLTDPAFQPYIQEFEYYYGQSVSHVPIGFDDLTNRDWAGVCYRQAYNGRVFMAYIKIDRVYWPQMTELQKLNLIFHELGHCALNRDHISSYIMKCPVSFMDPAVMSHECLVDHFQEYIKEMFP